jgi:hypothetical protein
MKDKIYFNRYSQKYNKYLKEIINQSEMIKIISEKNNREIKEDESLNIDYLVMDKNIFPFSLSYMGDNIGFICLDNINWENKNCRFKCAIFNDYINLISKEQLEDCISYVLNFSYYTLGLKRVSGIIPKDSFGIEAVNEMFDKEGEDINNTIFYYGNVAKVN